MCCIQYIHGQNRKVISGVESPWECHPTFSVHSIQLIKERISSRSSVLSHLGHRLSYNFEIWELSYGICFVKGGKGLSQLSLT
jgi:hypothetical protein